MAGARSTSVIDGEPARGARRERRCAVLRSGIRASAYDAPISGRKKFRAAPGGIGAARWGTVRALAQSALRERS